MTMEKMTFPKIYRIRLFFNWYKASSTQRQLEIDECLSINQYRFGKENVFIVEGRPTFSELFDMAKDDSINCFCNSDIYFTKSAYQCLTDIQVNECWALTRDDMILHPDARGSQDVWIFKGKIKPIKAAFYMGMYGCDNRIAHEIKQAGYDIKNPSLSVNIKHIHKEDEKLVNGQVIRTNKNTVPPPYLTLTPTAL